MKKRLVQQFCFAVVILALLSACSGLPETPTVIVAATLPPAPTATSVPVIPTASATPLPSLTSTSTVLPSPTSTATITPAPPSTDAQGQIVFNSNPSGSYPQIYIERADGSNIRQLVKSDFSDTNPVLSPDGKAVIFTRGFVDLSNPIGGTSQIFMVNVDGTHLHQLHPGGCVLPCYSESFDGQALSPDGKEIVFNRPLTDAAGKLDANGNFADFGLWIMKLDGSGLKQVTQQTPNTLESDESAGWSPDGKRLVFQRNNAHGLAIFTIATDGSDLQQVTPWDLSANDPAWSPDGTLIAFCSPSCELNTQISSIFTIHPDGTGLTQVTKFPQTSISFTVTSHPAWSLDGSQIVFTHGPSPSQKSSSGLFIVNRDGSGLHDISLTDLTQANPDWGKIAAP